MTKSEAGPTSNREETCIRSKGVCVMRLVSSRVILSYTEGKQRRAPTSKPGAVHIGARTLWQRNRFSGSASLGVLGFESAMCWCYVSRH